jgi:hypothetical protein
MNAPDRISVRDWRRKPPLRLSWLNIKNPASPAMMRVWEGRPITKRRERTPLSHAGRNDPGSPELVMRLVSSQSHRRGILI